MEEGPPCKRVKTEGTELQQQLQRGVVAGRKLVHELRQRVPMAVQTLTSLHDWAVDQLGQVEKALEKMEQRGENATEDGDKESTGAVPELQLVSQLEDSLDLLSTPLSSMLVKKESVVGAEAAVAAAQRPFWGAFAQRGPTGHVLHLLLLQLQRESQLKNVSLMSFAFLSHDPRR